MNDKIQKYWETIRPWAFSKLSLCICLAAFVSICTLNMKLYRVEAYFYDLRVRLMGSNTPDPKVTLLVVGRPGNDEENFLRFNTLENHIQILEKLIRERPAAIGYLNKFDPSEVEADPKLAERFVELASQAQNNGTRIYFGTDVDLSGEVLPPYPLSLLPHAPAFLYKDGSIFGEDKVVRRALLTANDEPALYMHMAFPELTRSELLDRVKTIRGSYFFKPAQVWHVLIHFPGETSESNNIFPTYYFSDILRGKPFAPLAGKIVLVDTVRKDVNNDFVFTPYSSIVYTHPRMAIEAATLNTLLSDNGEKILSWRIDYALTVLLSAVLSYMTMIYSPTRGVVSLVVMSSCLFLISLLLFKSGLWLRLVHPMSAMFFTYYLIVPYRAILEYKMRWDVQQKHDLLVQVEEMKGNFLSLMSHDLKTPVARIQGLAELILKQGKLQPAQEDEMDQIIQSTESLDKFISKILNLTKIESNDIKLNRRAKDINKIIEQCVQKLDFQARQKKIKLDVKLEPLFPIQMDAALIIQVFTNIIDNAIKYSNVGGSIEIVSREVGNTVEVQISDTGPGMDKDEVQQLFTKFFRGKSHPGDQSKGSGLGLYLSKYFIELHNGNVLAESEKGHGSRFTIQLPINSIS